MIERGTMRVYSDAAAVARALAETFVTAGCATIQARGRFRVALSGGNTPRAGYELLATPAFRERIAWDDVYIYFGDERCVPPTDDRSNYRMAQVAFLGAVGIPADNVYRMKGEIAPGHAANQYSSLLRTDLGEHPSFDLVLLGLGADGHTASLFPGTSPVIEDESLVRAVYAQSQDMWRITITPAVINLARAVVFAVEGAAKARALAAVYEGPPDPVTYPAQAVAPQSGHVTWLVDTAAAALVEGIDPDRN